MKIELEIGDLPEYLLERMAEGATEEAEETVTAAQAFCNWLEVSVEVSLENLFELNGVDEDIDVPNVRAREIM